MRLWSIHPKHLDVRGLVALWREGLLARAVLAGRTKGYRSHPQLDRFRRRSKKLAAIDAYLSCVLDEAIARGYAFDASKIRRTRVAKLRVTAGQMKHEWAHLRKKLRARDRARLRSLGARPEPHPCFVVVAGGIEPWERTET